MDGGAYLTLSPVVLSRGALHATGSYTCPNVRIRARSVATNTPPNGAFRGFGAPQTLFAAELHIEKIAAELGLDSLAVRRRNMIKKGCVLATGQKLRESVGAPEVLDTCVARSGYRDKVKEYARWNRDAAQPVWKGIGLALVHHGAGFTGRGEVMLASRAAVSLSRDGRITALAASTEIGQGTTTMLAQIDGGCDRRAGGVGGRQTPDTCEGAEQRSDRRQPHRHDRRRPDAARRRGNCVSGCWTRRARKIPASRDEVGEARGARLRRAATR